MELTKDLAQDANISYFPLTHRCLLVFFFTWNYFRHHYSYNLIFDTVFAFITGDRSVTLRASALVPTVSHSAVRKHITASSTTVRSTCTFCSYDPTRPTDHTGLTTRWPLSGQIAYLRLNTVTWSPPDRSREWRHRRPPHRQQNIHTQIRRTCLDILTYLLNAVGIMII